jgi:hypothetical protein
VRRIVSSTKTNSVRSAIGADKRIGRTYTVSDTTPTHKVEKACAHYGKEWKPAEGEVANVKVCPFCESAAKAEGARKHDSSGNFDTETYRMLFNGFLKSPTELNISSEKSIGEMDNEELTSWIYKLEDFVREAKVAKQAARVTIEDRKLQMTEEQRKKQREIDNKYKPAAPVRATSSKTKAKKGTKAKLTEEEKRIKACMDLMGKSEADAIAWLKEKGRL